MNQQTINFEKWTEIAKKMQEPFQAIAELNIKALQDISFIKPEELATLKKPEDLVEKQIAVAIENGHKALEHMQKSFQIIEKTMLSLVKESKKTSEKVK